MQIASENFGHRLWHEDCPKWMEGYPKRYPTSGVMNPIASEPPMVLPDGSNLWVWECLHCGEKCYHGIDSRRRLVTKPFEEQPKKVSGRFG